MHEYSHRSIPSRVQVSLFIMDWMCRLPDHPPEMLTGPAGCVAGAWVQAPAAMPRQRIARNAIAIREGFWKKVLKKTHRDNNLD